MAMHINDCQRVNVWSRLRLSDAHIVRVLAWDLSSTSTNFLARDYLEGETWLNALRLRPLSVLHALDIAILMAETILCSTRGERDPPSRGAEQRVLAER